MEQTVVSRMPDGTLYYGVPLNSDNELNGTGLKRERDGSIYAGAWSAGLREGYGVAFERSGLVCVSMWERDQPVGPCALIAPVDRPYFIFTGTLQEGSPQEGTTFFPDGRVSYGVFSEWKGSDFDGEGVLMLRDKRIYAGRWEDGGTAAGGVMRRMNGRVTGKLLNPRPGYTVKIWESDAERIFFYGKASDDDARNAVGIHFYSNGEVYMGELRGGAKHGKATFQAADGSIRIGEWTNGAQQGLGIWIQAADDEINFYFGEFFNNAFHGKGTQLRYHENAWSLLYCGSWENGQRNGAGMCCLDNGEVFHGHFQDNLQVEPGELILKDGTHKTFKQEAPAEKIKQENSEEENLKTAAENGQVDAQIKLADCYYWGRGVEKDLAQAFQWYMKAAEQGHASAQYSVGNCYYRGEGVEKNLEKAAEQYQKAAQAGNKQAQEMLTLLSDSLSTQNQVCNTLNSPLPCKVRETIIKAKKELNYDRLMLAEDAKHAVRMAIDSYAPGLNEESVIAIEETTQNGCKGVLFTSSAIYSSYFRNTNCIYYSEMECVDLFMNSVRICPRNEGSVYFNLGASSENFVSVVHAILEM